MQCLNSARDTDTTTASSDVALGATGRYSTTSTGNSSTRWLRIWVKYGPQVVTGYAAHAFRQIKVEVGSVATVYSEEAVGISNSAAIITNAAAIATESSARASADTTLTASVGTLTSSVATNASAIAGVNSTAAFWETVVSAGGGDLSSVRLRAGAGGSFLEIISTVLRLANVSNGAVIEVMRAIGGEAYFSRPISSDSGARRVTIGPGYGVSGQEVVLWFGPVATAPSSQSRTNGYFALGTDGKVYYGASELGVSTPQLSLDTVGLQVDLQTWPTDAQVNFTLTASGGVAPYTYAATKLSASGYAFASSGLVVDDFEAVMTGTSGTTRNGSETWLFSVTDDDGTVVSTVGQISLTVFG
jgi:hypothetical protein